MKIIYFGCSEKNYTVVKNVIRELDFLYEERLYLEQFIKFSSKLKKEILNTDYKKIYIISIEALFLTKCLKLVEYIRNNDWHSDIILIKDGNVLLTTKSFNIPKIFDVITKSNELEEKLKMDISLICDHLDHRKSFNYKNRDMLLNIYLEKILYIYRDTLERKVMIVTDNNMYALNMDLKDTFYLLDERFKQVHRACLVNMMRIEKLDWSNNRFILDNGLSVEMLSKHYRENIEEEIFRH